jgi:hypothetical protein
MNKLERIPFFLITIPAFFLLYNNNYYFGLLEWSRFSHEFLIYLSVPVVLFFLFRYLFTSWQKAGVLTSALLILFYFFQPIQDFLKALPYLYFLGKYVVLIPLLVVLIISLVLYLRNSKRSFRNVHSYINLLFMLSLFFELAVSVFNTATARTTAHDLADKEKRLSASFQPCDTCMTPDIYFFIFDEYTNHETLKQEFGYDNNVLVKYLTGKGFYIVDHSASNYNFTHMSIGSEANLSYLPSVKTGKSYFSKDFLQADYTVYRNELCKLLKRQGYQVENYSIFNIEGSPAHSPRPFRDDFFSFIFNQTLPKKLYQDIGWNFRSNTPKRMTLTKEQYKLIEQDQLRFRQTRDGVLKNVLHPQLRPVFTYAHFLVPHRPYYFDSTGKRLDEVYSFYSTDNKKEYLQQVVYANKFLIEPVIDSIFLLSRKPFVIILQGDHGYRGNDSGKEHLQFSNLNAIYFHDRNYGTLNKHMTSVNTFRLVFNKYFGTRFPILKDSSFFLLGNIEK